MKKILLIVTIILGTCMIGFSGESDKTPKSYTSSSSKKPSISDYAGKYSFADTRGTTYNLIINSDGTMRIITPSRTYYGSAEYFKTDGGKIQLSFSLSDSPKFYSSLGYKSFPYPVMDLNKEYIYVDLPSFRAKNPNNRFKLSR